MLCVECMFHNIAKNLSLLSVVWQHFITSCSLRISVGFHIKSLKSTCFHTKTASFHMKIMPIFKKHKNINIYTHNQEWQTHTYTSHAHIFSTYTYMHHMHLLKCKDFITNLVGLPTALNERPGQSECFTIYTDLF